MLAEIKSDPDLSGLPVIVISMLEADQKAQSLGANSHLMKPIDRQALHGEIQSLLGQNTAGMQALIIDDDADTRSLLTRLLGDDGFETATAANGKEGLEKLTEDLDLIVLDLSMPVMDGFEFLTNFNARKLENPPRIIIFSGMELDDTLRATLESVHVGFVDKNDGQMAETLKNLAASATQTPS